MVHGVQGVTSRQQAAWHPISPAALRGPPPPRGRVCGASECVVQQAAPPHLLQQHRLEGDAADVGSGQKLHALEGGEQEEL